MLLLKNVVTLDCADPGLESLIDSASVLLFLCKYADFFVRNGTDVGSGEMVSICSSEEALETGENSGRGTAENSVCPSDDILSKDECALPTVCPLLRGIVVRPLPP
jgi:hypothetical protein